MGFLLISAYFRPDLPVFASLGPLLQRENPFHPHSHESEIPAKTDCSSPHF